MILAYLLLLTGLIISAVAIYYSVVGLTAIFSAAVIPIIVMGSALEVGKLVCASWLKANWERAPAYMKYYMISAVAILMLITSMGIFGFLSKAHNDQNLVSGDVTSKIAIYDEKIKTAKENIEANRKQLKQMDEAVDQVMGRSQDEKGAEKANNIRKSQQRDRVALAKDIETNQKLIATLNDEAAPIRAEIRKVEAEVGPIKYIAKFIYGDHGADENMLEKAVTWIIVLIVIVFDPLAVIMLLAAQMTFGWMREQKETEKESIPPVIVPPVTSIEEKADIVKETIVAEHPPYQFGDEVHPEDIPSETPLTALGGDITATESQEQKEESELDKWNKMIAEAEAEAMAQQSTVEERVATGETYINNEGKEVALEVDLPESEESKKKTYMTKAPDGTMQVISLNK
jgi:CBS domain-containing protein